jgi:hypothetical protein
VVARDWALLAGRPASLHDVSQAMAGYQMEFMLLGGLGSGGSPEDHDNWR